MTDDNLVIRSDHVFDHGRSVLMLCNFNNVTVMVWFKRVMRKCDHQFDVCHLGSNHTIRAIGDIPKLRAVLDDMRPQLEMRTKGFDRSTHQWIYL